ncbi:glycosyl hydrolase family 7 [Apiospora phragmitis]|uniref:Glycosyl hydrolase family 7 n=1 Tax=Apiospora phragmitis TaxID=2905665 RepID=A0ABR1VXT8_9PEZI
MRRPPSSSGSCRARTIERAYDDDPNTTRTSNLRRQYHHLAEQHQSFHELFELLRSRPEDEALVILQRLRASGNVHHDDNDDDDVPFPPCPKNREEVMLGLDHSNAYPFLPPLEEIQSALGHKMRNISHANPDEVDWATAEEIENAK